MDQVTLWLVAGGVILLAFVVVGLVAVRRNSASAGAEAGDSQPPRGGPAGAGPGRGDSPTTFEGPATAVREREQPDLVEPETPVIERPEAGEPSRPAAAVGRLELALSRGC